MLTVRLLAHFLLTRSTIVLTPPEMFEEGLPLLFNWVWVMSWLSGERASLIQGGHTYSLGAWENSLMVIIIEIDIVCYKKNVMKSVKKQKLKRQRK